MCGKNLRRVHFRKASVDGTPFFPADFRYRFRWAKQLAVVQDRTIYLHLQVCIWLARYPTGGLFFFFFAFHLPSPSLVL